MKLIKITVASITLLVVLLFSFIIGTVIGFETAMNTLSQCEEVKCDEIGVQTATHCEVCETQLRILQLRR
jgi:hypothetical protein